MMNFFKIRKKVFCFKSNGLVEYFREKNQKSLWHWHEIWKDICRLLENIFDLKIMKHAIIYD